MKVQQEKYILEEKKMKRKFKIFLIGGKASSGKNTVAEIIKEYYKEKSETTVITSYAKYIKTFAIELLEWNGLEENKPRTFLQDLGSSIREEIHTKYFFTCRMIDDIKIYSNYADNVIVSDVRLPLELSEIKNEYKNVYSIKVNRNKDNNLNEIQKNHTTETSIDKMDDFDYVIENSSSLESLKRVVYSILEEIN